MVEVDTPYVFHGPDGDVGLVDLFDGRRQLVIYHFMFDPSWEDGCPSCTAGIDELCDGFFEHLHVRDTSFALVSRAPLAKLERWKDEQRLGRSRGSRRRAATSTSTSASRSTSRPAPTRTTTGPKAEYEATR